MISMTIQRANKSVSAVDQKSEILASSPKNIIDMAIYHKLKQVGWNPCSQTNCSHLCFSIPLDRKGSQTKAQCACPTHYVLSEDGTNCVAPEKFLLFSAGSTISRLMFDGTECPDAIVIGGQQQKQRGISALGWDGRERNVFWIDPKSSNIKRAYENGSGASFLLQSVDESFKPFDIAFDEVRRLLFWTCETYNSINVSDPTGHNVGSVLSSLSTLPSTGHQHEDDYSVLRPRHLALNPLNSHLYYSNDGRIERIRLDGMNRVIIARGGSTIAGLTIDLVEGFLYWTDAGPKRIERSDLDGKNRKVLVTGLDSPSSIAVMGRYRKIIPPFICSKLKFNHEWIYDNSIFSLQLRLLDRGKKWSGTCRKIVWRWKAESSS